MSQFYTGLSAPCRDRSSGGATGRLRHRGEELGRGSRERPHRGCNSSSIVEGFSFSTEIAVRFAVTDAQGVAHNAAYLVWFEVARIEYLARFRDGYRGLQKEGYEALTTEAHVRYVKPVYFDDRVRVNARCVDVRGARFRYEYVLERDGEIVADGWTRHAVVDRKTFRPTRFPGWLAEAIAAVERREPASTRSRPERESQSEPRS
jgi:acyl-CoA thioester hydrolase